MRSFRVLGPLVALACTTALVAPVTPAASAQADPVPGAAGIGDPYFPLDGNGGIDVGHYDVRVAYDLATGRLRGQTRVTLRATQDLSRFNLDFLLGVESVRVNGWSATFAREGDRKSVV